MPASKYAKMPKGDTIRIETEVVAGTAIFLGRVRFGGKTKVLYPSDFEKGVSLKPSSDASFEFSVSFGGQGPDGEAKLAATTATKKLASWTLKRSEGKTQTWYFLLHLED